MDSPTQAQLPLDAPAVGPTHAPDPPPPGTAPDRLAPDQTVHRSTAPPMLLTVRDVEAALQLGRTRTYELIRSGELPVVRLGRVVRVPRDALCQWIEERQSTRADG